jgi:RNA polymerase sigma-70 factor (family 1)
MKVYFFAFKWNGLPNCLAKKKCLYLVRIAKMEQYRLYDDKLLLELLAKSDEQAFTEIYRRFWQKLFVIAYNRLRQIEAAEDIVHDVFASLWANREKSEVDLLENYLATAAKYMVLAKIKKKERERVYNASNQAPMPEMQIEISLHYKRILELVKNEVEKLPEKCRLIFKCSRDEGMPVKQIAQELHLSPKTVENQLHKALKQLKLATKTLFHLF